MFCNALPIDQWINFTVFNVGKYDNILKYNSKLQFKHMLKELFRESRIKIYQLF